MQQPVQFHEAFILWQRGYGYRQIARSLNTKVRTTAYWVAKFNDWRIPFTWLVE